MNRRSAPAPHPYWATHAMVGFTSRGECNDHAKHNAPGDDYGIASHTEWGGRVVWEWYYPKRPRQKDGR